MILSCLQDEIILDSSALTEQLQEWQHFYNRERAHGGLHGKTPREGFVELCDRTPVWD